MAAWHWPLTIALVINAVHAAPAAAADIWAIGSSADKQTYIFVDATTLATQSAGVQSLSLYEVFEGNAVQEENGAKYFLLTVFFNCASHQYSNRTITVYDPSGKVLDNSAIANPVYQDATADSTVGMALNFACSPASSWTATYGHIGDRMTPVQAADALYKSNSPGG